MICAIITPFRDEPRIKTWSENGLFHDKSVRKSSRSRRLACAGCGTEFCCSLSGPCWCSEEAFRLPMPSDGSDCLCPDCLRKAAARAANTAAT